MSEKEGRVAPKVSFDDSQNDDGRSEASLNTLMKRVYRLANFKRSYTFNQQRNGMRQSWTDDGDDLRVHTSNVTNCVKYSYALPQFSVLALYMLLAIHATLLYEYLGAPLSYLAFFTAFARSLDVFTDPVMSWVTDSTRTRFGRRIPYMVCGSPFYLAAVVLLLGVGVINPPDSDGLTCVANGTDSLTNQTIFELEGGSASNVNLSMAYWYGATFVLFYLADTICNVPYNALAPELSDSSKEREGVYFTQNLIGMMGTLLGAVSPPLLEEAGLSKEYSFFFTGLFFGTYYMFTVFNLAANIGERTSGYENQTAVGLVPSTLRSMSNYGFRILLISWFIDAVGWFSLASVLPFYVKYVLQPGKAGIEWMSDEIFLGLALGTLLISAMIGMPFWQFLARDKVLGRYRTWLAYNLWNGISNALYLLVGPQDWQLALIVTVINGIPFGGKFLSDATLSDCIDYDEFISGERREAQFTVFSSFVPKIVSIPAQALPLAVISALGFQASSFGCSEDGTAEIQVAEQSDTVKTAIHIIFALLPVVANLVSFGVKTKYPFTTSKQLEMVSGGIELHKLNEAAPDPITGEYVPSPLGFSKEELQRGVEFDYFTKSEKRTIFVNEGKVGVVILPMAATLVTTGAIVASAVYGVFATFHLLEDPALSWAPSFLQIVAGLFAMIWVFTAIRLRHALIMRNRKPFSRNFMKRWIDKSEGGGTKFDEDDLESPLLSRAKLLLERLQEEDEEDESDDDDQGDDDEGDDDSPNKRDILKMQKEAQKEALSGRRKFAGGSMYAGSTRNFVVPDEAEKRKFMESILSGRNLNI